MNRRTKIILTGASATLVGALVVLRLSASRSVWSRIASSLHEVYGLDVESDDTSLALLSGQGTVRGLRILDAGASVLEAEEIQISASITDIFRGTYAFNTLVAQRPVLHIVVEEPETTNLARICARSPASAGPGPVSRPFLQVTEQIRARTAGWIAPAAHAMLRWAPAHQARLPFGTVRNTSASKGVRRFWLAASPGLRNSAA